MAKIPMIEYQCSVVAEGDPVAWTAVVNFTGENVTQERTYTGSMSDPLTFSVELNSTVTLAVTVNDDNGNPSTPSSMEFVAIDDVPPGAPEMVGFHGIRQWDWDGQD